MAQKFIQIHTLTNFPASLLNRDDAGFAKRMPFGGAVRTRISSQCLKRHWRVYEGEHSLKTVDAPESVRSRVSFDRFVVEPLVQEGVARSVAEAAARKLSDRIFGTEAKREKAAQKSKGKATAAGSPEAGPVSTSQVTVLGRPELDYICQIARESIAAADGDATKVESAIEARTEPKAFRENLKALKPGSLEAGLGAALFGRMVTGDILSRTDAAIHVAHAVTVHAQMTESDYFSAVDDLKSEDGELGSGHINATELTSGLFYGYVVVDVDGLVGNLGGDRLLAGDVIKRLVQIVATVSPGAKKGSTAPYAYSHLVLAEAGNAQPRTLQNAFIRPVPQHGDVVEGSYKALQKHLAELDAMYGKSEVRVHAGLESQAFFESSMNLTSVALWARSQVIE